LKRKDKYVVWPAYLDSTIPRRLGRRLPEDLAVRRPSLREIVEAAEALNLNPEVDDEARYPRLWWSKQHRGRVLVDKRGSKSEVLRAIAEEIKKRRSRRA